MSELASSITRLEASLATSCGSSFPIESEPDVVAQLIAQKRSPNTKRAYLKDLKDFFRVTVGEEPTRDSGPGISAPRTNTGTTVSFQL